MVPSPCLSFLQVSAEILFACAKFLKWKQLKHLAQTEDTRRIGECLVRRSTQPQAPYGQACPTSGTGRLAGEGSAIPVPLCFLQLKQKISRVEDYLRQSLPYVTNAQASLQQEAVTFIGESSPCFPVWALPWQQGEALCAHNPLIVPPGGLCLPRPPAHAGGAGVPLAQAPP